VKINLNIERLILDGLPIAPEQSHLVQVALEGELGRLLAANGVGAGLQSGAALASIRPGAIQLGPNSGPAQIGRQIARAVYSGIGYTK
jgi:hypothetical protein